MSNTLVWKNHSRIVEKVSPHLTSAHEDHHNDLLYQKFLDNLWQVPITNFQQLHPYHCCSLHQTNSCCVDENICPPYKCLIHNCCQFYLEYHFIRPHLFFILWQVYVYLQWETHHELHLVGVANLVSFV